MDQELRDKSGIARDLNNIGSVYYSWGRYQEAIENFQQALKIDQELGDKSGIARDLNNIGMVYQARGRYQEAFENYQQALKIFRELNDQSRIANCLNNIGMVYYSLKQYREAEDALKESIKLIEQLRLTATGEIRSDYLTTQIHTYQGLISTYVRQEKPHEAFNTVELTRAKYLTEQLGGKLGEKEIRFSGIENYQKQLDENTAILCFTNINWDTSIVLVVTKEDIKSVEMQKQKLIDTVKKHCGEIMREMLNMYKEKQKEKRKARMKDRKELQLSFQETEREDDFEDIITFYRILIDTEDKQYLPFVGKELYSYLFEKIEPYLKGKSNLVLMPDGILNFLPFETLIMPDGKYLVEHYDVQYTPSLTTLELIEKRKYPDSRKSLIAFGGAVYQADSYKDELEKERKNFERLKEKAFAMVESESKERTIQRRGEEFVNLPGTFYEAQSIGSLFDSAVVITGDSVSESVVKRLSESGELKRYKVLHIAVHGIFNQDNPESSAVVLTLPQDVESKEDGHLILREISSLQLEADLVNLSACVTALGRIYNGEGVMGLTQAFLVAGANSMLVTLWELADNPTMAFMTGMYKMVRDDGLTYSRAVTDMKRAFIRSDEYRQPYYWAAFVYYGK